MENVEAMGRTLDPSQPWVKDARGCHTNLAALLDWPDLDSDDEVFMSGFLYCTDILVKHLTSLEGFILKVNSCIVRVKIILI